MAGWFHEDVGACFEGIDGLRCVPVIGRGDDDHVGLFEEFAVIFVSLRRIAVPAVDLIGRDFEAVALHVAERDDLAAPGRSGFLQDILTPPTATNERRAVFRGIVLAQDVRSACQEESGRFEEGAAFHVISGGDRQRLNHHGNFGNRPNRWREREPSMICRQGLRAGSGLKPSVETGAIINSPFAASADLAIGNDDSSVPKLA